MKRKQIFGFAILAVAVIFALAGCASLDEFLYGPSFPTESLEGTWNRGDIVITFNNEVGVFTQINSNTDWHRVQRNGEINIGDQKIRNIRKTGNLTWTAQDLSFNQGSFTLSSWQNCTITLNPRGNYIRIITDGVSNPDNTYTRVR